jgi:hypothetical protein
VEEEYTGKKTLSGAKAPAAKPYKKRKTRR